MNYLRDIDRVSRNLRAEFARGDGRVKRKEDARRTNIIPSETLFVVNFHVETTRKSDLELLFRPYGELLRIEMKKNYAFVQFASVEEARKAKEATNGGKLDQSAISVEYVESRIRGSPRRPRDDYRSDYRGGPRGRPRDYRDGGDRFRGPPSRGPSDYRGRDDRYRDDPLPTRRGPPDRYDDSPRGSRGRGPPDRYDDSYDRPYRGRSRSRSRSPPPMDRRPRYDDRDRDGYGGGRGEMEPRGRGGHDRHPDRGRSQERDYDDRRGGYDRGLDRDRDRDRGYRYERGYPSGGRGGEHGDEGGR